MAALFLVRPKFYQNIFSRGNVSSTEKEKSWLNFVSSSYQKFKVQFVVKGGDDFLALVFALIIGPVYVESGQCQGFWIRRVNYGSRHEKVTIDIRPH